CATVITDEVPKIPGNAVAKADYELRRSAARESLARLNKNPLASTAPLQQMIDLAENLAASGAFEQAFAALEKHAAAAAAIEDRPNREAADKGASVELVGSGEPARKDREPPPPATPEPLRERYDTARALADGGKYKSALELLGKFVDEVKAQKAL